MGGMDRLRDGALAGEDRLITDALTGLRNAHLFRLRLPHEFSVARERETNAALLVVRLDTIAALNAAHGRSAGDDALRTVANVLDGCRAAAAREGAERPARLAFRLGGPVFGFYMTACSAAESRATAEEIRRRVSESRLFLERLSVSIGVVNLYELFLAEGTPEEIARRIEEIALYRLGVAAGAGTNTICDGSDIATSTVSRRPSVLVIDPDAASLELLLHALEAADLEVRVCEDGESGLESIQSTPPAVIICEAMTPRLDGFTIRERLRANACWNTIPFILVSHRKTDEQIRRAVAADIRHYFRKPISITEVAGLVTNLTRAMQR
jgi:diguanylate cyclase (GGDEF)-like protein